MTKVTTAITTSRKILEREGEEKVTLFYRAPVLDCSKGKMDQSHWDLTRVELNARRLRNDDFTDDYGQV